MNRRDFVSKAMSALFAGSWPSRQKLPPAQTPTPGVGSNAQAAAKWTLAGTGMRTNLGDDGTIRAMEQKTVASGRRWSFAAGFRRTGLGRYEDAKARRFSIQLCCRS